MSRRNSVVCRELSPKGLMKSCDAGWSPRFARMKSSACRLRWNEIRLFYPHEVGFHCEAISPHASGICSVRKDGFRWKKHLRKQVLFSGGRWWIRTTEVERQQIYSLPPLAAREISLMKVHIVWPWWSWWSESNQQPADYKSAALPLSHTSERLENRTVLFGTLILYHIVDDLSSVFWKKIKKF